LQRVAQRLTSLIALLPSALVGGRLDVNVGASPAAEIGAVNETAPGTDTASSGLNGRLQRIAQRLTSLIALLPSALVSGRLDVNLGAAPTTVTTSGTTFAQSAEDTLQNAAAANGNGSTHSVASYGTTVFSITGSFSATVNFEVSADGGTTWYALSCYAIGGSDIVTTATAAGLFRANSTGCDQVRARISGYASGNVTVKARSTNAPMSNRTVKLGTGTNNIGDVDVLTVPADPFGVNADAASATGSISAKLRHLAATGIAGATALPAGTNNIGDVDVLTVNGQAPAFGSGVRGSAVQRVTVATDDVVQTIGSFITCSTDVTRPADTTAYAANDALSNSTSAPTSGGFTWTSAARVSGGSGIITDAMICTSADAGTLLQGEIFIFNQAVTNINDNAAFAISDAEAKTCIGKIPFTLEDIGNNGWFHATNLNIGFTCVGTADLRFLVRVKNAYTPASAEVLTFVVKILRVD
jgi:hypothetical protein